MKTLGRSHRRPRSPQGRRLRRAGLACLPALAIVTACDKLLTDPAPPETTVGVQFQIDGLPTGGPAEAFAKVRRVAVRFIRADSAFRDTVFAVTPSNGAIRVPIALEVEERIEALGIIARLGLPDADLFEGRSIVQIEPGGPTTATVPVEPVAAAIQASVDPVIMANVGDTVRLESAVLFASLDTIPTGFLGSNPDSSIISSTTSLTPADTILLAVTDTSVIDGDTVLFITIDTIVSPVDTVLVPRLDTIVVGPDTTFISGVDTVIVVDTVLVESVDTLIVVDTIVTLSLDTVVSFDTVITVDTVPVPIPFGLWISEDPNIVSVTPDGLATAVGVGQTRLEVRYDTLADTVVAGIAAVDVIEATPSPVTVTVGEAVLLTTVLRDAFGNVLTGRDVTWTSTDPSVASVDATGIVIGVASGTTTVVASSGTASTAVSVTVPRAPALIEWTGTTSGTWSDPANWGGGLVPTVFDTVAITLDGTYELTLDTPVEVASLVVGGAFGSQSVATNGQPLTVGGDVQVIGTGRLTVTGNALTAASLVTDATGEVTLSDGVIAAAFDHSGTLLPQGVSTVTGPLTTSVTSRIIFSHDAPTLLTVTSGFTNNGSIELNSTTAVSAALEVTGGALVNSSTGTVTPVAGGGGTRTLRAELDNQGLLSVTYPLTIDAVGAAHANSGTIDLGAQLTVTDADALIDTGVLDIIDAETVMTFTGNGPGFSTASPLILGVARTLAISGGPVSIPVVDGDGTLLLSGLSAGGATMTVQGSATLRLDDTSVTAALDNQSIVVATGGTTLAGGFTPNLGSSFTVASDGVPATVTVSGGITNSGTLRFDATLGTVDLDTEGATVVNDVAASMDVFGGNAIRIFAPFDNRGTVNSSMTAADISIGGIVGASFSNTGNVSVSGGGSFYLSGIDSFSHSGSLDVSGGEFGVFGSGPTTGMAIFGSMTTDGTGFVQFNQGTVTWDADALITGPGSLALVSVTPTLPGLTLGINTPDNLILVTSDIPANAIQVPVGTGLILKGGTIAASLDVSGSLLIGDAQLAGEEVTTITGVVTTTTTSTIDVLSDTGFSTSATFTGPLTINGSMSVSGTDPVALSVGSLFEVSSTGSLDFSGTGARTVNVTTLDVLGSMSVAGTPLTISGTLFQAGTMVVSTPVTVSGQLFADPDFPAVFTGNNSSVTAQGGVDITGATFDNVPLVLDGGTLASFSEVTFQNMDPAVDQLTVNNTGAGGPFTFFSISFLTTPNSGSNYLVANDTDGGPVFLEITMSGPAPLTPGGFINVVNGAVINW